MPSSSHYGHENVQIKDYITQMKIVNKENLKLCESIKTRFSKANDKDEAAIIDEREKELADAIDHKIEHTIEKLRTL
jgi:hypothetical protein